MDAVELILSPGGERTFQTLQLLTLVPKEERRAVEEGVLKGEVEEERAEALRQALLGHALLAV